MHIYIYNTLKSQSVLLQIKFICESVQLSVFFNFFFVGENNFSQNCLQVMAQPDAGAPKAKKSKSSSFSRKVTLIKFDDECTSFSEMRNLPDRSVIELSTRMTQDSVKNKILETFPYLEKKR